MKQSLFLFLFIAFSKISYSQNLKQSIDYQYYRDDKSYYAFELFKDVKNVFGDQLMLNFTSNSDFKKIDKIYVKAGELEVKLKFKWRAETVVSDNPEQKFYPISFDSKDLEDKKMACDALIIFKLDNGFSYSLPFNTCGIKEWIAKN